MNTLLNKQFDNDFDKIENLKWYPWVGENYLNNGFKVLIIGESQYAVDENGNYCKETSDAFKKDKAISREYFFDAVNQSVETKNFYRSLFKTYTEEITVEWLKTFAGNIAFYHFFQSVDRQVSGNNRNKAERLLSWRIWNDVVNILRPDLCVVHGISIHKYFDTFCKSIKKEYKWEDIESGFYVGQQPIQAEFVPNTDKAIDLIFLRHPSSRGYSYKNWRNFLHCEFSKLKEGI